jgi:uncharacterized coiled-coil protein SlyX
MSQKINVDIITEYKGRQNLKSAEKDMGALGHAAKELGKIVAATFATEKIIEFGKASVEAFAADEKSAKILGNTLNNLGLSFTDIPVEKFITNLSELNGIAKTDLRNSFSTLVRSTGDATKAQDLLALGLDISSGTGKDLASVTKALAKAYGGSYTALSKLGAGLTKAEIATGNFAAIQAHLAQVFKGDAAVAAESFSGKIARLKTSFEEFKITIGAGLVDAFTSLSKGGDLTAFQETMHSVAMDVADMVRGIGIFGGDIASIVSKVNSISGGLIGKILGFSIKNSIVGALVGVGSNARAKAALQGAVGSTLGEYQNTAANNARAAANKKQVSEALIGQKKITDEKAKQFKLDQAALGLKLAGNTTDMKNIEIQAALQRGQTEQITNVLLAQRAEITGNTEQARALAEQILRSNGLVMDVRGNISSLATAKDPFSDWPKATDQALSDIAKVQAAVADIQNKTITITVLTSMGQSLDYSSKFYNPGAGASTLTDYLANTNTNGLYYNPGNGVSTLGDYLNASASGVNMSAATSTATPTNLYSNPGNGASTIGDYNAGVNVTVMLNGQSVSNAITSAQVDQSASGIPNSFQRNYAGGW